jgi:hypothetical protein
VIHVNQDTSYPNRRGGRQPVSNNEPDREPSNDPHRASTLDSGRGSMVTTDRSSALDRATNSSTSPYLSSGSPGTVMEPDEDYHSGPDDDDPSEFCLSTCSFLFRWFRFQSLFLVIVLLSIDVTSKPLSRISIIHRRFFCNRLNRRENSWNCIEQSSNIVVSKLFF